MAFSLCLRLALLVIIFDNVLSRSTPINNGLTLRIVHTNDMHSKFEQTSALSSACTAEDASLGKCYGGFARLATLIRQAKKSDIPTLFLNAGDTYQGTPWYAVHKWRIVSKFLEILKPDAMSLGNHEFDDGPEGLVPFINASTFPILVSNLDLSEEPELAKTPLKKSIILDVGGHKVGIIGYLTPETKILSSLSRVKFLDEVTEIRREVKNLQEQGIKILIALGHSGYTVDKKIAAEVDGIDLVIGGHSHDLLYTGKQPHVETVQGPYPTEIIQKSGKKIYVVQAYAQTKYMGNLTIVFDRDGEITSLSGTPILVDSSIEQAGDVLAELEKWRPALNSVGQRVVGSSKVFLEGNIESCGKRECNLGNLITDAMVQYNADEQLSKNNKWTDTSICFINAGVIRSSINKTLGDKITMNDILTVLPFGSRIVKIQIPGSVLLEVLEVSVYNLVEADTHSVSYAFLQYSGILVTYDLSRPRGSRVVSARAHCSKCDTQLYEEIKNSTVYTVLTIDFLQEGGDGYKLLKNLVRVPSEDIEIKDILAYYLEKRSPVNPEISGRINFVLSTKNKKN